MSQELTSFTQLNLSQNLLKALEDLNYITPSPIQQQTIPWLLQGKDVIGQAQTGTGKTAAFALPILQQIVPSVTSPQALILTPTRELAIQVAEQFERLGAYQQLRVTVLCGGQDYRPQLKKLREGVQVVVGTPGRILDHLDRGTLQLNQLKTFILDEADEMLRMGFIEDVEAVLAKLPEDKQMALFSATMPPRIRQIAKRYLNDPVSVEIRAETATVKTIEQQFLFASQGQKSDVLLRVLAYEETQGVIVFVRTKSSTEEVANVLQGQGYRAMAIHGDLTQPLRERIIAQFKQGSIDILVATDVAARGLDVDRVTHVINYDMAHDCETYVHRIGRTARAGRSGVTILFVTPRESKMINLIERHTRQRITKVSVPTDSMIQTAKQNGFLAKITQRLNENNTQLYRQMLEQYIHETQGDALEIAAALALLLNQDKPFDQTIALPPMNSASKKEPRAKQRVEFDKRETKIKGKRATKKYQSETPEEIYRIDVGRVHGVKPGNLVGAIANEGGLQSRDITGLTIHDDYSTVRLPKGMDKNIVRELNKAWVCGRQLKLTSLGAS